MLCIILPISKQKFLLLQPSCCFSHSIYSSNLSPTRSPVLPVVVFLGQYGHSLDLSDFSLLSWYISYFWSIWPSASLLLLPDGCVPWVGEKHMAMQVWFPTLALFPVLLCSPLTWLHLVSSSVSHSRSYTVLSTPQISSAKMVLLSSITEWIGAISHELSESFSSNCCRLTHVTGVFL